MWAREEKRARQQERRWGHITHTDGKPNQQKAQQPPKKKKDGFGSGLALPGMAKPKSIDQSVAKKQQVEVDRASKTARREAALERAHKVSLAHVDEVYNAEEGESSEKASAADGAKRAEAAMKKTEEKARAASDANVEESLEHLQRRMFEEAAARANEGFYNGADLNAKADDEVTDPSEEHADPDGYEELFQAEFDIEAAQK